MTVGRARSLFLALPAVGLASSGAGASNDSSVKSLGIEVHFTQCTDSATDAFHLCGEEKWTFKLDETGWSAKHANVVVGVPGQWTSSCKDGVYRADIGGKIWPGKCLVTGDQGHLCLKSQSTGVVPGEPGGQSEQCFDLSAESCAMEFQAKVWQLNDEGTPSLYLVTARDVTKCVVSKE